MQRSQDLLRLWDYTFEHSAMFLFLTCKPNLLFGDQIGF